MALFVKRTFAIMVNSTSRTDQSDGGRGGKMEEDVSLRSTRESWTSSVLWGMSSLGAFKRNSSETIQILSQVNPVSSLNWGQLQSWSRLPGQWPVGITISASLGWEQSSEIMTLHSLPSPSKKTSPRVGLRPGCQSKWNGIILLLVTFCPFHR